MPVTRHTPMPSLIQAENIAESRATELKNIIDFDHSDLNIGSSSLRLLAQSIKKAYRTYHDSQSYLILQKLKNGSLDAANDHKNDRRMLKDEVNEAIITINALLEDDVVSEISSCSTPTISISQHWPPLAPTTSVGESLINIKDHSVKFSEANSGKLDDRTSHEDIYRIDTPNGDYNHEKYSQRNYENDSMSSKIIQKNNTVHEQRSTIQNPAVDTMYPKSFATYTSQTNSQPAVVTHCNIPFSHERVIHPVPRKLFEPSQTTNAFKPIIQTSDYNDSTQPQLKSFVSYSPDPLYSTVGRGQPSHAYATARPAKPFVTCRPEVQESKVGSENSMS